MKKVFIALSLVLVIVSFTACDNTGSVYEVYSDFLTFFSRKSAVDDLIGNIPRSGTWVDGSVDYTIENPSDFSSYAVIRVWKNYNQLEREGITAQLR